MGTTLLADNARAADLKSAAGDFISRDLTPAQVDELELLLGGLLAPLGGYLGAADFDSVRERAQLSDGTLWPFPLTLAVDSDFASATATGVQIALRDPEGVILAILTVADVFERDGTHHLGGSVEGLTLPLHYDHRDLRNPQAQAGDSVALIADKPIHRTEIEAATKLGSNISVIAPIGGLENPFPQVRALRAAIPHLPREQSRLSLIPTPPATEAKSWLLLALIAKNLGYKTLLASGNLELAKNHSAELGIEVADLPTGSLDDSYPEVVEAVHKGNPSRSEAGLTVFFTGLSGSGKSTIANILRVRLMERGGREVSLLDGDLVRKSLSSELTFSKEHRNINILRIGYVASEITKHGGLAICAPIAPYDGIRQQVRDNISANGGFVLVHVATPLEACEARDRKGLYAMARAGKIKEFTGISDPYEEPADAELVIQTTEMSADEACDKVIAYLEAEGYLPSVKS